MLLHYHKIQPAYECSHSAPIFSNLQTSACMLCFTHVFFDATWCKVIMLELFLFNAINCVKLVFKPFIIEILVVHCVF